MPEVPHTFPRLVGWPSFNLRQSMAVLADPQCAAFAIFKTACP
jgi:hypothetical protein